MATVSQLPASCNLVCTVGNDFTLTLAVTENGSTWSSTGATLATDIIARDGTVVATDFTTAATDGQVTLTLTDANTTALGVGVYSYRLSVTKSGNTRDWIAGTLSVVEAGIGGTTSSAASLSITTGAVSLSTTTLVAPAAANISVADAGGYYTGDDVEEVLQEISGTPSTSARRLVELATDVEALARTDAERAVTPANLAQFTTLSRHSGAAALPTSAIAQTIPRHAVTGGGGITSGRQHLTLIWLPAGTVNSITFVSYSTAATSPTNQWFTLYDSARTRLAVTNDDTTTAWAANTAKTLTISGGYTIATEGYYYVGIVVAAATPPTLAGTTSGVSNPVGNVAPSLAGPDTANLGLTTPATAPAGPVTITVSTLTPYAYVS
jgi:hypothetical protein